MRGKPAGGDDLPRHVAIIMDGNGRWAKRNGRRRPTGHRKGAEVVREITRECARLGIERLTLYSFSSENWKRPKQEVVQLMRLLKRFLIKERGELRKNNLRFEVIGRTDKLPADVRREMEKTIELCSSHSGMVLCLALSYGAREEIVDAVRRLASEAARKERDPRKIEEADVAGALYAPGSPDPELLIRTGGDFRLSNFLLWQVSYTELWMTPRLWPEFRKADLHRALRDYAGRERRFGGIGEGK